MTRKRDYVLEIRDRRSRLGGTRRLFERLSKVLTELDRAEAVSDELMRHFPVAMIACLETYTRTIVQELVDSGPPFSDRIEAFGGLKIEIETMKAIHGRRITLGELLGHLTPVSSLADVQRAIGPLINADVIDIVKSGGGDVRALIEGVTTTFRLRHVYAHEFQAADTVDRPLIIGSVRAAAAFLSELDKGILAIAFSQTAMNEHSAQRFDEVDKELTLLLRELNADVGEKQASRLAKAQKAWRIVRDQTAAVMADLEAEGGSMSTMVYNRFAAAMTRNRLQELQDLQQFRW